MSATAVAAMGMRPGVWKPIVTIGIAIAAMFGLHALTAISFLDTAVVVAASVAALWWITARDRLPRVLNRLSLGALVIAVLARVIQGPRWQLVMWQLVAVVIAMFAGLRMWRPDHSIKLTRILGRAVLFITLLLGSLALLMEPSPTLPAPSGEFHVGSQVFQWTDPSRAEALTADQGDTREVVGQAWYPSDVAEGSPTAYIGTDASASLIPPLPTGIFEGFDDIDTHATDLSAISAGRSKRPVLLFSPGLSVARQSYSALCAELASRGYVVVAMSHPYDSPASQLASGDVVSASDASGGRAKGDQIDLRAADSSFVLDQLHHLAQLEPESPLVGHLDLDRVGIFGHSFGGATAVQAIANDPRFLAGLNIDGNLFSEVPALDRPFLWLQTPQATAPRGQDELLDGLTAGGAVVTVDGSVHMSFSDYPAYLTPAGRQTFGRVPMIGWGSATTDAITPITADIVAGFFGPIVGGSNNGDLAQVARRYRSVMLDRSVESR